MLAGAFLVHAFNYSSWTIHQIRGILLAMKVISRAREWRHLMLNTHNKNGIVNHYVSLIVLTVFFVAFLILGVLVRFYFFLWTAKLFFTMFTSFFTKLSAFHVKRSFHLCDILLFLFSFIENYSIVYWYFPPLSYVNVYRAIECKKCKFCSPHMFEISFS